MVSFWFMRVLTLALVFVVFSDASGAEKNYPRPATIEAGHLKEFETLSPDRKALVIAALKLASGEQWLKYTFGSADPKKGGFDCSGATYFLLRELSYHPARSAAGQYLWIRNAGNFTKVGPDVQEVKDPVFHKLQPGDLVFWSGTYVPADERVVEITHVAIYLGTEKQDGRPVMACSTNGRSYRGRQSNGFGVYDFRVPSKKSKSRLVAFGTPPAPPP